MHSEQLATLSGVGKKHHIAGILLLKQQFFFSQSDFEIPGNPHSVLDPGDTSHVEAVLIQQSPPSKLQSALFVSS
jgi:hypothetical protein